MVPKSLQLYACEFMKLLHEHVSNKLQYSAEEKHLTTVGAQETQSSQACFQAAVWGLISFVNGTKAENW